MAANEKRTLDIQAKVSDQATGALSKLSGAVRSFASQSIAGFKGALGAVFNLKNAVTALASSYAAIKIGQFVHEFIEQGAAIGKLAQAVGDSVENLSELQGAVELSAIGTADFNAILKAFLKTQQEAIEGSGDAADVFRALGISTDEPSKAFEKIALALEKFTGKTEKLKVLRDIFGKQFIDVAPLLTQGLDKFQDFVRQVREAGGTVTGAGTRISDQLGDSITKLKFSLRGVGGALVEAFGPRISVLLDELSKKIAASRDKIADVAKEIAAFIVGLVDLVVRSAIEIIRVVESIPFVHLVDKATLAADIDAVRTQLAVVDEIVNNSATRRAAKLTNQVALPRDVFKESSRAFELRHAQMMRELADIQTIIAFAATDKAKIDLLPKKEEFEQKLKGLLSVSIAGLSGSLEEIRADLASKLAKAGDLAVAVTVEPAPNLAQKLQDFGQKIGDALGSVFRPAKEGAQETSAAMRALTEETSKAIPLEQQRLAIFKELAQLAPDFEPLRVALRDLDQQEFLKQLEKDAKKAGFSIEQIAGGLALARDRFAQLNVVADRAAEGLGDPDFFGGFKKGLKDATTQWTDFAKAGNDAANMIVNDGLNGLVDGLSAAALGTKSLGDAFKEIAAQIISDIVRITIKLAVMKALELALGLEAGGVVPGGMEEPVPERSFARGGIARRPMLARFGEGRTAEAFVPLPDGRSIPVSWAGGGPGGGNSLTVNIWAMDSKDVQRVLSENHEALSGIFQNSSETRNSFRHVVRRAVA